MEGPGIKVDGLAVASGPPAEQKATVVEGETCASCRYPGRREEIKVASLGLSDANRAILERYAAWGGQIGRIRALRDFLFDQVHHKRCTLTKAGRFKVPDALRLHTDKVLLAGHPRLDDRKTFPCAFQSELENCLLNTWQGPMPRQLNPTGVLYNCHCVHAAQLDVQRTALAFVPAEWSLADASPGADHTRSDADTLARFRNTLLDLMRTTAQHVLDIRGADAAKRLLAECRRFERVTRFCE